MTPLRSLGVLLVMAGLLSGQVPFQDPVLKAQAERGQPNLPPVPRGIQVPPPLPPPETHVKDTPGYRARRTRAKVVRKSKRRTVKPVVKKLPKKPPVKPPAKPPTKRP